MPKFDFDSMRAEKEQFDVTVDGRTIVFAKEVPTDRVLDLRKRALAIDEADEESQQEFFLAMGREVMSDEHFDYLRARLGVTELFTVIDELCIYYGIQDRADDVEHAEQGEGKVETPETPDPADPGIDPSESKISSSISEPSNPTSNVIGLVPIENTEPASSAGDVSSVG